MPQKLITRFEKITNEIGTLKSCCHFAVSISGGADSTCLLYLSKLWADKNNKTVIAITVNHKLRENSYNDITFVKQFCDKISIRLVILDWEHDKISSGIQEKARKARYDLICDWCNKNDVSILLVGHHLNDQIETFIMRQSMKSGNLGLSCMSLESKKHGISIIRPLLSTTKTEIKNFLGQSKIDWIEDPSNQNEKFLRVRIRNNATTKTEDIIKKINYHAKQRIIAEKQANEFLSKHAISNLEFSYALLQKDKFLELLEEIQTIVLHQSMWFVSCKIDRIKQAKLKNVTDCIKNEKATTCNLCNIMTKNNSILICRESRNIEKTEVSTNQFTWDKRFVIFFKDFPKKEKIIITQSEGKACKILKEQLTTLPELLKNLSSLRRVFTIQILKSLPSICINDTIISIPLINWQSPDFINHQISCKIEPIHRDLTVSLFSYLEIGE